MQYSINTVTRMTVAACLALRKKLVFLLRIVTDFPGMTPYRRRLFPAASAVGRNIVRYCRITGFSVVS